MFDKNHRPAKKISESQKLEMVKLYVIGNLSQSEIGEMYDITSQYVSKILRSKGCETNRGGWRDKKSVIQARHNEILRLHGSGWTLKEIASKLGMSASGVGYVTKKYSKD